MGTFATTAKNTGLDAILGNGTPASVYIAAYVADVEVAGNGYVRVPLTNNATNFPAAAAGAKTNGTEIAFPQASGNWGTIDEIRGHRHATNEDVIFSDDISKAIETDDVLRIEAGDLDLTISDPA